MTPVPQWTVFETELESAGEYGDPWREVDLRVRFSAPSGGERTVAAFWDGGRTWRVRFCPTEPGAWRWQSECNRSADAGLHGREGSFECAPYAGDNPLYRHGSLRPAENGRYLAHADGTPFFWLGDTAWNGALRARPADWERYLQTRRAQGFSAIQLVSTPWRGCSRDPAGETAFSGAEPIRVNPRFFQRLDPKLAAINRHGLLAVPVIFWAFGPDDPGQSLPEADAIELARYVVARWGAFQVAWLLAGDGDYSGDRAPRWQRIGSAVFAGQRDRPVTLHPRDQSWVGEEFREEGWFDFIGYQGSGHGGYGDHVRWLLEGPPATHWDRTPPLPVINLEPNYEAYRFDGEAHYFATEKVRRAAYWSLLVSPTAGVSFGHSAIWLWANEPEVPEGHARVGTVAAWPEGLNTPGIQSMVVLQRLFHSLPWWQLRPAPELLLDRPGASDPDRFVAAARTGDGAWAILYLPDGGSVRLDGARLAQPAAARWFNPRTGAWTAAGPAPSAASAFSAPSGGDWVLCIAPA